MHTHTYTQGVKHTVKHFNANIILTPFSTPYQHPLPPPLFLLPLAISKDAYTINLSLMHLETTSHMSPLQSVYTRPGSKVVFCPRPHLGVQNGERVDPDAPSPKLVLDGVVEQHAEERHDHVSDLLLLGVVGVDVGHGEQPVLPH